MNDILPNIEAPELFFGFVAPIGVETAPSIAALSEMLKAYDYKVINLKVTDAFPDFAKYLKIAKLEEETAEKRYESYIQFGDALRKNFDNNSFTALYAVKKIIDARMKNGSRAPNKTAFILHQFKRREEIELLRAFYGRSFFQVSIYAERNRRVDFLSKKIAQSYNDSDTTKYREVSERLVTTNEHEHKDDYGQRVSEIFHEADFIVNTGIENYVSDQIKRMVDLVFGSNSISPNKREYGLYIAKSAALRSLDLSRQVGAAIFSAEGEIISMGANEVPKAGGGTYWCDDDCDDRDYKRNEDSNDRRKRELLSELAKLIAPERDLRAILDDDGVRKSQFMDALEYGRIVHAEMSAISDAARLGRSLKGATLYCTTFPCHMCAKHIVAAGIKEVVYLEPYPKSLASGLHGDSIKIDGKSRGEYDDFPFVNFKHFYGASPLRYRDFFERKAKRKSSKGMFKEWRAGTAQPIVDLKFPGYLLLEPYVMATLLPLLERVGFPIKKDTPISEAEGNSG